MQLFQIALGQEERRNEDLNLLAEISQKIIGGGGGEGKELISESEGREVISEGKGRSQDEGGEGGSLGRLARGSGEEGVVVGSGGNKIDQKLCKQLADQLKSYKESCVANSSEMNEALTILNNRNKDYNMYKVSLVFDGGDVVLYVWYMYRNIY